MTRAQRILLPATDAAPRTTHDGEKVAEGRMRGRPPRHTAALTVAALLLSLAATSCGDPGQLQPKHSPLLKTFVDELIDITPGEGQFPKSFTQGSDSSETERPPHEVTLTKKFAIAKYEVPQNLYEAVMGSNSSRWKGPRNSAESMTWTQANTFCKQVTDQLHAAELLPADEWIRLPTESEWEYCARAGTITAYSFGDKAQNDGDADPKATLLDPYAWHTGNAAGNDPAVGVLKPNPWGLYDVHGYLWEFCADDWHANYDGAPNDGSAWKTSAIVDADGMPARKVLRGGSWKDSYDKLRSPARRAISTESRDDAVGFRCVRSKK